MIISPARYSTTKTQAVISSEMVLRSGKKQTVYFAVDKKYRSYLMKDTSAFLSALLIPAMAKNEQITVYGTISKKLLKNTQKIFHLLSTWKTHFPQIAISAQTRRDSHHSEGIACFFSGGADSFYTFLKHKKEITHFILVHGFDIPLANKAFFDKTRKQIQKVADKEGITLICVETNIKEVTEPLIVWDWEHGGALASVALLLRKRIKHVYIGSAVRNDQLFPYGTHPKLDPLWGTESLTIANDGSEYDRLQKIIHIVGKSPLALAHLRVCPQNLKGRYNCGKCFKCVRTMMELVCAGTLSRSKTFPKKLDLTRVRAMYYKYSMNYHYAAIEILNLLKKEQREIELQSAIEYSLQRSKREPFIRKMGDMAAYLDQKYFQRFFYQSIFTLNSQGDRSLTFKTLARIGFIK